MADKSQGSSHRFISVIQTREPTKDHRRLRTALRVPVVCPIGESEPVLDGNSRITEDTTDPATCRSTRHDRQVPKLIVRCQGELDSVLAGANRPVQQLGTATHTPYG